MSSEEVVISPGPRDYSRALQGLKFGLHCHNGPIYVAQICKWARGLCFVQRMAPDGEPAKPPVCFSCQHTTGSNLRTWAHQKVCRPNSSSRRSIFKGNWCERVSLLAWSRTRSQSACAAAAHDITLKGFRSHLNVWIFRPFHPLPLLYRDVEWETLKCRLCKITQSDFFCVANGKWWEKLFASSIASGDIPRL